MALAWTWLALPGALAFALALAAAIFVLRSAPDRAVNRRLPPLLLLESALALGSAVLAIATPVGSSDPDPRVRWVGAIIGITLASLPVLYLRFLATVESPLTAWLRRPRVDLVLVLLSPLGVVAYLATLALPGIADALQFVLIIGGIVGASLYGIAASISLLRRSPAGSARRAKARAYATAFIARDAALAALLVSQQVAGGETYVGSILLPAIFAPLAIFLYVPLMAYGALKTQLFDIDLKVKLGIERSTLLTIVAIAVLVTQRVVERYATATYGWIAAVVVAVGMLLLKSRLDKVASKVANTAMPKVQPTAGYVQFKKLEVYKAAVETSIETGGIDARERVKLDRLRDKLGLDQADASALEADVAAA